jgi:hypothetical protein
LIDWKLKSWAMRRAPAVKRSNSSLIAEKRLAATEIL